MEIERKFTVKELPKNLNSYPCERIERAQGYRSLTSPHAASKERYHLLIPLHTVDGQLPDGGCCSNDGRVIDDVEHRHGAKQTKKKGKDSAFEKNEFQKVPPVTTFDLVYVPEDKFRMSREFLQRTVRIL